MNTIDLILAERELLDHEATERNEPEDWEERSWWERNWDSAAVRADLLEAGGLSNAIRATRLGIEGVRVA